MMLFSFLYIILFFACYTYRSSFVQLIIILVKILTKHNLGIGFKVKFIDLVKLKKMRFVLFDMYQISGNRDLWVCW